MPPIPIYAHSPINAAKADGVTPQTAEKPSDSNPPGLPPTITHNSPYAPAQPGAVPSIPVPTSASSLHQQQQQQHPAPPPQPTRTQPLNSQGPPPPQPGAFPVPVPARAAPPPQATATGLPPPPKAGDAIATAATTTNASQALPAYYPPQMSVPAPPTATTQGAQRGTTTAAAAGATTIAFGQAPLSPSQPLEHPPGYQQNPNAGELDRYQRAAQEALDQDERAAQARVRASSLSEGADGVWGSVRGAMAAAGEKIAAAEEKVWKTINKDL